MLLVQSQSITRNSWLEALVEEGCGGEEGPGGEEDESERG